MLLLCHLPQWLCFTKFSSSQNSFFVPDNDKRSPGLSWASVLHCMSLLHPQMWCPRKITHLENLVSTPLYLIFTMALSSFITVFKYSWAGECHCAAAVLSRPAVMKGFGKRCCPSQCSRSHTGKRRTQWSVGAEIKRLSAFSNNQTFMRALLKPILKGMKIWRDLCGAFIPNPWD